MRTQLNLLLNAVFPKSCGYGSNSRTHSLILRSFGVLYFFFSVASSFFFRGHLPVTSCFCLAKQIHVAPFPSQARARILTELQI